MASVIDHASSELTKKKKPAPKGAQSVIRVISLLKAFNTQKTGLSLTEIGTKVGLPKTTVHRMLTALLSEDMVERDDLSGRYRLGTGILMLAASIPSKKNLIKTARPLLEQLARETSETVTLEVISDNEVALLDEVRSGLLVSSNGEIGTHWPLHATSTGKVYLSYFDHLLESLTEPLTSYTSRTITDINEIAKSAARIKRLGYATTYNELQEGYAAVAAPLMGREGEIRGAICLGGPTQRMQRSRLDTLGERVKAVAQKFR
jgi:IclR family acetate operon transcriptional repressor